MQGVFDVGLVSSQVFWFLLGFSILCGFFYIVVFPKLSRLYSKRKEHILSYTNDADTLKEEAEKLQKIYEQNNDALLREIKELKDLKMLDHKNSVEEIRKSFTEKISKKRALHNSKMNELESIVVQELEEKASVYASMILSKLNSTEGK